MRGCFSDHAPEYIRMRTTLFGPALALATLCGVSPALAGNVEAGEVKAYTCTGCHGIPAYNNVYPTYHVPKIGGQNEAYIVAALKAYRSGERQHPTMQAQAGTLTDEDIADIAAYFVSLTAEGNQ